MTIIARLLGLVGKLLIGPVGWIVYPSCALSGACGLGKAFSSENIQGVFALVGLFSFTTACVFAWWARTISKRILGRVLFKLPSCENSKNKLLYFANLAIFGFGVSGATLFVSITKDGFFCGACLLFLCLKVSHYKEAAYAVVPKQLQAVEI